MKGLIERSDYRRDVRDALSRAPVVALLGPRQCGKTTLARQIAETHEIYHHFDLESIEDSQRLTNAEMVLGKLEGLVVLDEIQRRPELFGILRVLVDRPDNKASFIVLGSASPALVKNTSESLAGRVEFIDLHGFNLSEVGADTIDRLWCRGGFPRSFLAASDGDSIAWREGFIRTFLERDLPQLGITIPSTAMRRFWTMVAHSHGQTWNASKLAGSMSLSDKTVRSYLDILSGTYMVLQLQPWFENIKKRQVKAPKIYLRDSGILHSLLTIETTHDLLGHPMLGASWEGFAIEEVMRSGFSKEFYFWSVHGGMELDLLSFYKGKRIGFECKVSTTPSVSASMKKSMDLLTLDHLYILSPSRHTYPVHENVTVCPPWLISSAIQSDFGNAT